VVETTGRSRRADKRGLIESRVPRLLERLSIDPEAFIAASTTLLKRFGSAVGSPTSLTACCAARQARHLRGMRAAGIVTVEGPPTSATPSSRSKLRSHYELSGFAGWGALCSYGSDCPVSQLPVREGAATKAGGLYRRAASCAPTRAVAIQAW